MVAKDDGRYVAIRAPYEYPPMIKRSIVLVFEMGMLGSDNVKSCAAGICCEGTGVRSYIFSIEDEEDEGRDAVRIARLWT